MVEEIRIRVRVRCEMYFKTKTTIKTHGGTRSETREGKECASKLATETIRGRGRPPMPENTCVHSTMGLWSPNGGNG